MAALSLHGRKALVTGGSRGIGRAISVRLAEAGAWVCVNFMQNEKAASETLRLIRDVGGQGETKGFDVADGQAVGLAVEKLIKEQGRIDILVNNAGVTLDALLLRLKDADWQRIVDTNLKGTINCCQAVARHMMKQRWGRIINMTSVVGEGGNPGQTAYAAAKAGIIGFTRSLAREFGSRHICVNAISPGFIETDMTSSRSLEVRNKVCEQIPLGRLGRPEDVAGIAAFLASEEAGYITGQVIRVNGGLYM
jgi:3-oxoacyl-[acyl-carrier protein] reductase